VTDTKDIGDELEPPLRYILYGYRTGPQSGAKSNDWEILSPWISYENLLVLISGMSDLPTHRYDIDVDTLTEPFVYADGEIIGAYLGYFVPKSRFSEEHTVRLDWSSLDTGNRNTKHYWVWVYRPDI
jgi:hypothetical protein